MTSHVTSHVALSTLVKRKAACQPQVTATMGTVSGAMISTDIRAGIEDTGGEGALAAGKPLRDGLDGGWKVTGFAEAEQEARGGKSEQAARQRVAHRCDAPHAEGERIADARAHLSMMAPAPSSPMA